LPNSANLRVASTFVRLQPCFNVNVWIPHLQATLQVQKGVASRNAVPTRFHRSWWITHSTQHYWKGCNSTNFNASTKKWLQAFSFDCMQWSNVMHNEIKCCPGSSNTHIFF